MKGAIVAIRIHGLLFELQTPVALCVALTACTQTQTEVTTFVSPAPTLGTTQRYIGKLAITGGCLTIEMGGSAVGSGKGPTIVAVPLLNRGLRSSSDQAGFALIATDGTQLRDGDLVTGEGAPYPSGTSNGSAPVPTVPDTRKCPGQPYQINSMHRFSG